MGFFFLSFLSFFFFRDKPNKSAGSRMLKRERQKSWRVFFYFFLSSHFYFIFVYINTYSSASRASKRVFFLLISCLLEMMIILFFHIVSLAYLLFLFPIPEFIGLRISDVVTRQQQTNKHTLSHAVIKDGAYSCSYMIPSSFSEGRRKNRFSTDSLYSRCCYCCCWRWSSSNKCSWSTHGWAGRL